MQSSHCNATKTSVLQHRIDYTARSWLPGGISIALTPRWTTGTDAVNSLQSSIHGEPHTASAAWLPRPRAPPQAKGHDWPRYPHRLYAADAAANKHAARHRLHTIDTCLVVRPCYTRGACYAATARTAGASRFWFAWLGWPRRGGQATHRQRLHRLARPGTACWGTRTSAQHSTRTRGRTGAT